MLAMRVELLLNGSGGDGTATPESPPSPEWIAEIRSLNAGFVREINPIKEF